MGRLPLLVSLFTSVLLASCTPEPDYIVGNWRAVSITQGGDSLRVNNDEVGFSFQADRRYKFTSTLRYREAGRYRLDNGYLFATDTTQPDNPERVVAVELLNQDSLILRMQQEDEERMMTLLRAPE